jgi:hypothetical protein
MLSAYAATLVLAAVAPPFNLICTGTMETTSVLFGKKSQPYTTIYRVDPTKGIWCDGECKAQHKIADDQPGVLVLEPTKNIDTPNQHETFSGSINRETGAQNMFASSGIGREMFGIKWTGTCEKSAFTGFGDLVTKF